jgi:ABC-type uncharacterized transport system ATPase subunit
VRRTEVELEGASDELVQELEAIGATIRHEEGRRTAQRVRVTMPGDEGAKRVLALALAKDARIVEVHESRETLEDLFLRDSGLATQKEDAHP